MKLEYKSNLMGKVSIETKQKCAWITATINLSRKYSRVRTLYLTFEYTKFDGEYRDATWVYKNTWTFRTRLEILINRSLLVLLLFLFIYFYFLLLFIYIIKLSISLFSFSNQPNICLSKSLGEVIAPLTRSAAINKHQKVWHFFGNNSPTHWYTTLSTYLLILQIYCSRASKRRYNLLLSLLQ